MGTLINPLSRILGYKKQIFWGNNYSFNYLRVVYRQKNFQIKCFKRLFKYLFRYLTSIFNFPRIYYSLSLNFIGQANSILDIKIYIHNLSNFNIAFLLMGYNSTSLLQVNPALRNYHGVLRSRLQKVFEFSEVRYCKLFLKWRGLILNLFLQKLKKKKQIIKKNALKRYAPYLTSHKIRKLKLLIAYSQYYKLSKFKNLYLNENFKLKYFRSYIIYKFKFLRTSLHLYKSMNNKFLLDLVVFFFNIFIIRLGNKFNILCVKLNFKKKKNKSCYSS